MTERQHVIPASMQSLWDGFHFAPAVGDEGGTVWCSGVLGTGADGRLSDDPAEQFRQALANATTVLTEAGCDWGDVVDITTFHVDLAEHLRTFAAVKDEVIGEPYPAWTAIGTTGLALPGALVEVKVVARRR
jgi:enamine deaminase RidA (YjgF/YER057c/UK114 family)